MSKVMCTSIKEGIHINPVVMYIFLCTLHLIKENLGTSLIEKIVVFVTAAFPEIHSCLRIIPCQLDQSLHVEHCRFSWNFHCLILSLKCEKSENLSFLALQNSKICVVKVLGNFTYTHFSKKNIISRPYQSELICFWKTFRWKWHFSPIILNDRLKTNLVEPYPPLRIPKSGNIKNVDILKFFKPPTLLNRVAKWWLVIFF